MNYYEQFYDDLEVYDPAEEEMLHREPPVYWEEEDYMTHRDQPNHHRGRGRGYQLDRGRGNWRGRGSRGHANWNRGRGNWDSGRRGGAVQDSNGRGRGVRDTAGRGRGIPNRGAPRGGKMNFVNFVKAGEENISDFIPKETSTLEQVVGDEIQAIRKDCQAQQDKTEATNVFTSPVLSAYGYGDGSDFKEFGASSFYAETSAPSTSDSVHNESQQTSSVVVTESQVVRKPMAIPALNFVKAKSEFKSTDVAFHEVDKPISEQEKVKRAFSAGNKRAGLGMDRGINGDEALTAFQQHKKEDGSNPHFDARFAKLRDSIKKYYNTNRNAIEMFHIATTKCKMKINDTTRSGNRTESGQILFSHQLDVDGIVLGRGETVNKKAAKHEAFNNALKLLIEKECTVREVNGLLELKPVEDKSTGATSTVSSFEMKGSPDRHLAPQVQPVPVRSATNASAASSKVSCPTSQLNMSQYVKPKIVFHQASNSAAQTSPCPKPPEFSPSELANKLVQSVKEDAAKRQMSAGVGLFGKQCRTNPMQPGKPCTSQQKLWQGPKRKFEQGVKGEKKKTKKLKAHGTLEDLSEFIIYDNTPVNSSNTDMSILHLSANHNNVVLKLEYGMDLSKAAEEVCNCSLILGERNVADGQGCSKEEAKTAAAKQALSVLRDMCYTIVVKQTVDSDESGLTKEELLGSIEKRNEVIPDSNVGNMLLRKMGWAGGGVGKDGTGIAEPIKAEMVIGREGLGLSKEKGIDNDFHSKVHGMLFNYVRSNNKNDLYFTPELTKEEREVIHKTAQKLGLKSQSKGKGDERFLIVSHKRSAGQLLEHVMECGGSTSKYEIIPPSDMGGGSVHRESLLYGHNKQ